MKSLLAGCLLLAAVAASGCAPMGMDATLQVRSAPPPPTMAFNSDPQFNYLSNRRVGVIADESFGYDMFNSDGNYYLYNGGYWYRSSSARGSFTAVERTSVPSQIFDVDDHEYRWRKHPDGWRGGQNQGNDDSHHGGQSGDGH